MARECTLFSPLLTKDAVKAEFYAVIQSGDRGVIASQFPDIAALLWVLDVEAPTVAEIENYADPIDDKTTPPHGWWGGLKKKLGGGV
jgi:hypothetical protein